MYYCAVPEKMSIPLTEGTFTLDPPPPGIYTVGAACYIPPPPGIWLSTLWEVYFSQKCCICCTMFFYAKDN